jgi:hypothetical protein
VSTADPEDTMRQMIDALDLPAADPETNVQLLNELELCNRFDSVTRELMRLGETLMPKTQHGRDLHSTRAAYLIEMKRRGLR